MLITELSIKRPAFSWVLSLILVLFGSFVFWKLPVRELPSGLQPPVVQVNVEYSSASSQIVDEEVTQVLEEVIGGAEGIKNIDSSSKNGKSKINIEFETDIDLDDAANDIRERVARVVERLPSESDPPRILKQAAGFTTTMWLSLSSPTWSDLELGDYVERYLIDQFSSIKNVGRIRTGGLRELSVRVWIDPIKLAAYNLTTHEVELALNKENVRLPAGSLEADNKDLTLNIDKSYNDLEKLKQLPIKKVKNNVVKLSDVAEIEFGPVSEKAFFRSQSKNALNYNSVGIGIYARSGASTVELSNDVKDKIRKIKPNLPAGLNLEVAFNRATYISVAINEVYKTLFIAFILVVIIIYLFLGNLKAVIVPAIALPLYVMLSQAGLVDTYSALILPWTISVFGIFLMRQFFMTVPDELIDAARMDGMGEYAIVWKVMLPTAIPALLAFAIFSVVAHWNDYFWPRMVITGNRDLFTPPLGIREFRGGIDSDEFGPMMASIVTVTVPLIVAFIIAQKRFIEGITLTGMK